MAKIDKIQVGTISYDINLPTTATPTITSLTVTGNLTVSGTANLSVINPGTSDSISIYKGELIDYSSTITTPSRFLNYMTFNGDYIMAGHDGSNPIQREHSHYYFPDKTIPSGAQVVGTTSYKLTCTRDLNELKTELNGNLDDRINNLSLFTSVTNIAAYQPGAKNINVSSINITQSEEPQTNLMLFQTTVSYPNQSFSFSTGHIYIKYVESSTSYMIPIILFCYESGSRGTYMQSSFICLTSQLYTGDLMNKGS